MRIAFGEYRFTRLLALLVLACVSLPKAAYAQSVGTITQLTGTAQIERAGVTTPAAVSMPIQLHDKITTAPASTAVVGLVDNGQITVNESSTLVIDDSVVVHGVTAPSKVSLVTGSLRALILGDLRSAGGGFEIHTPNAIGAVRGTDANVAYTQGGQPRPGFKDCTQFTDFYVNEGKLYVTNAINQNLPGQEVETGHQITVACGYYAGSTGGSGMGGFFATDSVFIGAGLATVTGVTLGTLAGTGVIGSTSSSPPPRTPLVTTKH
jgi:hypothetical protein